mmetsp:Transcript_20373/g.54487  ORF Transcript_20373/g.54487 Transcript_20373/m.54487 type:complete len:276 (-) Transcript_20373:358-1185(-)
MQRRQQVVNEHTEHLRIAHVAFQIWAVILGAHLLDDETQPGENGRLVKAQENEDHGYEVHALAVSYHGVPRGVGTQHAPQRHAISVIQPLRLRPGDVELDLLGDILADSVLQSLHVTQIRAGDPTRPQLMPVFQGHPEINKFLQLLMRQICVRTTTQRLRPAHVHLCVLCQEHVALVVIKFLSNRFRSFFLDLCGRRVANWARTLTKPLLFRASEAFTASCNLPIRRLRSGERTPLMLSAENTTDTKALHFLHGHAEGVCVGIGRKDQMGVLSIL